MKTVKFFLGAMALAVVSMVAAPAVNAQENKDAEGNTIRHPYLTNGLWDNWFVNVNPVGLNLFYDGGEWATGYAIDVNVGKWVTPSVGLRAGFNGITGADSKYGYIHGDAMWNISNAIGGYKETRLWNFIPYVGAGVSRNMSYNRYAMGVTAGLLNQFRLSNKLAVNLDLSYGVHEDQFDGCDIVGDTEFSKLHNQDRTLNVEVGLTYNLGKAKWNKTPDVDAIKALSQNQIDALNAQLAPLTEFKAAAEKKEKEAMIAKFYMLSDEDKKDVIDNKANYSLDDIEAKLSVIAVRNNVVFTKFYH